LSKINKKLVLLTSHFPFGNSETFLENEFPFLKRGFSEITIATENHTGNCRISSDKIEIIKVGGIGFFNRISSFCNIVFWCEIVKLIKSKSLTFHTFRTAWYSLSKVLSIKKSIHTLFEKSNFNDTIFYSYWLDEKAITLGLLKRQFPNSKCISRAHGWDIYQERHKENYLPFRSFILNEITSTFTISQNGKNYLSTQFPQIKDRISVSRLGTFRLHQNTSKKESTNIQILSISSIIPLKRVDKILKVISQITERKIHWTHIGDGSLYSSIHEKAKATENQNPNFSFTFLGQKSNTEVREFLSEEYIDLFINLSETEGIPVSIMEAQSAGIPVLATAVGGTSEIVNNENGILVNKDEKDEIIAQKIKNYLDLPEVEKQKKRELSYQNWKEYYNAETNYTNFIQTILELKP
jgi:glycosyltransferase involved in cell wall biosynthesis